MESGRSFGYCFVSFFFFFTLTDVLNGPLKLVCFTLIENDHLGDWSPEKDCCWRLTFLQPVQKPSSEAGHVTPGFKLFCYFSLYILFPISDHVMFSCEFSFCYFLSYVYICTCIRLFPRVASCVLKWENKKYKLKKSIEHRRSPTGVLVPLFPSKIPYVPIFPHVFLICSPFNKFAYHFFVNQFVPLLPKNRLMFPSIFCQYSLVPLNSWETLNILAVISKFLL